MKGLETIISVCVPPSGPSGVWCHWQGNPVGSNYEVGRFWVDESSGHQRCPVSHVSRPFSMSFSMEMSLLSSSHLAIALKRPPVSPNESHPHLNKSPRISMKKPATPITTEQNSTTPATGVKVQRGRHVISHRGLRSI